MKTHIKNSEIPTERMTEGITRQIMGYDSNLMVVKVFFVTGAIADRHKHPHQQIGYIEKGRFEVELRIKWRYWKKEILLLFLQMFFTGWSVWNRELLSTHFLQREMIFCNNFSRHDFCDY